MSTEFSEKQSLQPHQQPPGSYVIAEGWQGPLPSPASMEVYERLNPGAMERFMTIYEQEILHRRALETADMGNTANYLEKSFKDRRRAHYLAFLITAILITAALSVRWFGLSENVSLTLLAPTFIGGIIQLINAFRK